MPDIEVSEVRFAAAADEQRAHGLLGWVRLVVNRSLRINGITVRRTLGGRLVLSFPAVRGGYSVVQPIDDRSRIRIEEVVLSRLKERGEVT